MAEGGTLMLLVGAAVGWFLVGPAVNGPIMSIVDKFGGAVAGAAGGGKSSGSRGSGKASTGGSGGSSSYGYIGTMTDGMLTHYPN